MKTDTLKQFFSLRAELQREREQLEARLREIALALGEPLDPITGSSRSGARRGPGPRAGNTMSLKEAVIKALSVRPMTRQEVLAEVQRMGYKFTSKNPLNSLG